MPTPPAGQEELPLAEFIAYFHLVTAEKGVSIEWFLCLDLDIFYQYITFSRTYNYSLMFYDVYDFSGTFFNVPCIDSFGLKDL